MYKLLLTLTISITVIGCGNQSDDQIEITANERICDCYQNEHEVIGIDFYKEINAYKDYIAKVSLSKENNFSKSLISNYEEMTVGTFEIRPSDTVFQKSFLQSINIEIVQKCVAKHSKQKSVADLIQRLDLVGMSDSFTNEEQLEILITLEKDLITSSKVSWLEPFELNAFFYMYDRYNEAAQNIKIEVVPDLMPLPPPPPPVPAATVPEEIEETEDEYIESN